MGESNEEMEKNPPKHHAKGSRWPQYLAAVIANMPGFCNGMILGWPSVAIPILQSADSPLGELMTNDEVSFVASLVCLVALFCIPVTNVLSAKFGNKMIGYTVGASFIAHWIIIISTSSKVWIYIARGIGGLASACVFALCPQYTSEIAEDEIRGMLGVFFITLFNLGFLFIHVFAAFMSYSPIAITCLIPPVVFLSLFFRMPETPVNLLLRGKSLEATKSLQWLRGKGADITEELGRLKATVKPAGENMTMSFKEMFSDPGTRRGVLIVMVLCINSQFTGIFVFLSYLGSIFLEAGSDLSHITASIIVATLQLFGTIASSYLVENKGRKFLLILSNLSMTVCLAALGVYFYLKDIGSDVSGISWLPVTSLSVYVVVLSIGVSPLTFVVLTEICLPAVTKFATTMGYCIIWLLTFLLSTFFKTLSDSIGIYVCYWFFAISCTLGALFTHFVMPETKGRAIQEIHFELSGRKKSPFGNANSFVYAPASVNDDTELKETTIGDK
ncbi:facilitated trehalose transporter Tret1 [Anabrus simplex]|uniref:facilitated trehalose transporter Tret1 n=1 Tax=Anabrus simplex TaxID=316456 RepID=UPI0035A26F0B